MEQKAIALGKLRVIAEAIDSRPLVIRAAREQKATWEEIAESLQMSRAAVITLSKK